MMAFVTEPEPVRRSLAHIADPPARSPPDQAVFDWESTTAKDSEQGKPAPTRFLDAHRLTAPDKGLCLFEVCESACPSNEIDEATLSYVCRNVSQCEFCRRPDACDEARDCTSVFVFTGIRVSILSRWNLVWFE
jgi:hypothetical protein